MRDLLCCVLLFGVIVLFDCKERKQERHSWRDWCSYDIYILSQHTLTSWWGPYLLLDFMSLWISACTHTWIGVNKYPPFHIHFGDNPLDDALIHPLDPDGNKVQYPKNDVHMGQAKAKLRSKWGSGPIRKPPSAIAASRLLFAAERGSRRTIAAAGTCSTWGGPQTQ